MKTRTALLLLTAGLVAHMPARMAHASSAIIEHGYKAPAATAVENGGFRTPDAMVGSGGFLTALAGSGDFASRIERVRQMSLNAAEAAKCAPAPFKRRFKRRLLVVAQVLGSALDASPDETPAILHKASVLNQAYCGKVAAAIDELSADCAANLRMVCPRLSPSQK